MSDARRTTVYSMARSKVKVTSHSKLEIWPFSEAISSAIYMGSWQLTTDSLTRAQYLNLIEPGFWHLASFFVSRDFEVGTVRPLWKVYRQSRTGLIYLCLFCIIYPLVTDECFFVFSVSSQEIGLEECLLHGGPKQWTPTVYQQIVLKCVL